MKIQKGLKGVVVDESKICEIDGQKGELYYRGYSIEDLAKHSTFEEVTYLLWYGELPDKQQSKRFQKELTRVKLGLLGKHLSFLIGTTRETASIKELSSIEMLRTVASLPPRFSKEIEGEGLALTLLATFPIVLAAHERLKRGKDVGSQWVLSQKCLVYPSYNLSIAANLLYMLRGERPSDEEAAILDRALVLHAEHDINASTFTARVITSTGSDMRSAITGAIGALKGPLHGGANKDAMDFFEEIAANGLNKSQIEKLILEKLSREEKIPGIGHVVYRITDPRAKILKRDALKLLEEPRDLILFEIAETVREIMEKEKGVYPNVDFYSGFLYRALGIPGELFIPLFVISRTAGWIAHIFEQQEKNRIIRPILEYVGHKPRKYPVRLRS